ncbi:zinc finger domain-containing protein [Streptomyces tendae]
MKQSGLVSDDFERVESHDCPMSTCAAPAGSPCRTGKNPDRSQRAATPPCTLPTTFAAPMNCADGHIRIRRDCRPSASHYSVQRAALPGWGARVACGVKFLCHSFPTFAIIDCAAMMDHLFSR